MTWTDPQIIKFSEAFRDGVLDGHLPTMRCFMVCAPLVTMLNIHGVKSEIIETDLGWCNHFWLQLADGRALDPTADQFNYLDGATFPKVYLGALTKYHRAG